MELVLFITHITKTQTTSSQLSEKVLETRKPLNVLYEFLYWTIVLLDRSVSSTLFLPQVHKGNFRCNFNCVLHQIILFRNWEGRWFAAISSAISSSDGCERVDELL
jgi:hypothetical protein